MNLIMFICSDIFVYTRRDLIEKFMKLFIVNHCEKCFCIMIVQSRIWIFCLFLAKLCIWIEFLVLCSSVTPITCFCSNERKKKKIHIQPNLFTSQVNNVQSESSLIRFCDYDIRETGTHVALMVLNLCGFDWL